MKADTHTHSKHSPDGYVDIAAMAQTAVDLGADYLAITDHCDMDTQQEGNKVPVPWRLLDLEAYQADFFKVKEEFKDKIYLAFGIEAGYDKRANGAYQDIISRYNFDIVINSVHFVSGWDAYFPYFFDGKIKSEAYTMYLEAVYESLFAPYRFDIVGHVGYCVRNAPYEDKVMHYADNPELIDKIFLKVIELKKALEVNRHNSIIPNIEMLQRYHDLGGRKISFGSDAHRGDVFNKYQETCEILKKIGFTQFTIFKQGKEEQIEIE